MPSHKKIKEVEKARAKAKQDAKEKKQKAKQDAEKAKAKPSPTSAAADPRLKVPTGLDLDPVQRIKLRNMKSDDVIRMLADIQGINVPSESQSEAPAEPEAKESSFVVAARVAARFRRR